MTPWQQEVLEFMKSVKGLTPPTKPTIPDYDVFNLCRSLIREEGRETTEAISRLEWNRDLVGDMAEVADGICDTIYVLLYTANALGIDIEPCWNEVQRSNMAKKGGSKREDGKQLKPANWTPPDILSILEEQINA